MIHSQPFLSYAVQQMHVNSKPGKKGFLLEQSGFSPPANGKQGARTGGPGGGGKENEREEREGLEREEAALEQTREILLELRNR